ncbi:tyrosine-type recombinase/integrase [Nonomuraea basaltis]|uniref:tyrosine-type recombinase/integrase n=1 Tax=Nonomuraea basaltis TaxID=2495887 RepID=UPI001F0F4706|nr:site-specific integrase [Nonomuraea basaltis]
MDDDHGSWYFAVQLRGLDGQRQRIRQGGYADPEEAQAAGHALAAANHDGAGAGCTLGQWLTRWLATKDALRPSTRQGYSTHIRLYLIPQLGRIRLHQLTSRDVNGLLAALASRPSPTGRRLSPATVVRIHATLRTALNAAVRARLIPVNPANGAELPRPRRPHPVVWTAGRTARRQQSGERPAVAVWTEQQLAAFLTGVAGDRLYAAWWLAALRGLRRGELAGLRWTDVDLQASELTVAQQRVHADGQVVVGPPKSVASCRVVALDAETVRVLTQHRKGQEHMSATAGTRWQDSGYVFTTATGAPLRPDYLTGRFRRLVSASGLPPIRLHDLRHGAATLALAAHTDLKVVQAMLGHASIVLTADTYVSVLPEVAHRAAQETAGLVLRAASKLRRELSV